MFWTHRLREPQDESWALPFGDLMSLLLAVFVMIAAMSELRPGAKFDSVRQAVRGAFGFQEPVGGAVSADSAAAGSQSGAATGLLSALEAAGLAGGPTEVRLLGEDDRLLAPCRVESLGDRLVLRLEGEPLFGPAGATLTPPGLQAVRQLGTLLAEGSCRLEVCGLVASAEAAGPAAGDRADLGHRRARAAAEVLTAAGVSAGRIRVSSWIAGGPPGGEDAASGGGLEIVMYAEGRGSGW